MEEGAETFVEFAPKCQGKSGDAVALNVAIADTIVATFFKSTAPLPRYELV